MDGDKGIHAMEIREAGEEKEIVAAHCMDEATMEIGKPGRRRRSSPLIAWMKPPWKSGGGVPLVGFEA
jgi:hypothetical protein